MSESEQQSPRACHYFVDEAGDGMLFNRRKQVIVGREGCSHCFILGALEVDEPPVLHEALESLRTELRADPYLVKVPSMQPERRKTAIAFHAKDAKKQSWEYEDPPKRVTRHEAEFRSQLH
jgi:hypothetical protein